MMMFKGFSKSSFLITLVTLIFCFNLEGKLLKLNDYKWQNRLLVVADPETETFLKQQQLFKKHPTQNIERKLLLFYTEDKQILKELKLRTDKFSMVLIGLDGYVKNRYSDVTEMSEIYDVIDSMPMRQSEDRN